MNWTRTLGALLFCLNLAGCSGGGGGGDMTPTATPTPAAVETPEAAETPEEAAMRVFFVNLADGDKVKSPMAIEMGVEGMTVRPAGTDEPDTGHHHIIVDGTPIPEGEEVPADETHFHFGQGQTETTLELEPGEHTLTLQFADFAHKSYGEKMSSTIVVVVEE